jgi:hypothetical protein
VVLRQLVMRNVIYQENQSKVKHYLLQAVNFLKVQAPRFHDSRHMKVVRLSAQRIGRLYPQEVFLILISVGGLVDLRTIVRLVGLCQ